MAITLQEVARLIQEDDKIIIENQETGNKSLQSMDKNLKKFLENEKNGRGDRLEAERERNKLLKGLGKGAAAGGAFTSASKASKGSNIPGILSGIKDLTLLGAGLATAKGALKLLGGAATALSDVMSKRAKTQRGLSLIEADELKKKQKAERLNARAESDRLKVEERSLRAESAAAHRKELAAKKEAKRFERQQKMEEARAKMREADKLYEEKELKKKLANRAASDKVLADERALRAKNAEIAAAEVKKARSTKASRLALERAQYIAVDAEYDPRGAGQTARPSAPSSALGDDAPSKSVTQTELSKFSDTDLETAGFKRVQHKDGRISIRKITPGGELPFASPKEVLAALKRPQPVLVVARRGAKAVSKLAAAPLGALLVASDAVQGAKKQVVETAEMGQVATNLEKLSGGAGGAAEGIVGMADLGIYAAKSALRMFTGKSNEEVAQESFGESSLGSKAGNLATESALKALRALGLDEKMLSAKQESGSLLGGFKNKEEIFDYIVSTGIMRPSGVGEFNYSKASSNAQRELDRQEMAGDITFEEWEKRSKELTRGRGSPQLRSQASEYYASQPQVQVMMEELARLEQIMATYEQRAAATVNAPVTTTDASTNVSNTRIDAGSTPNPHDVGGAIAGLD